jgi:hypothetical protein
MQSRIAPAPSTSCHGWRDPGDRIRSAAHSYRETCGTRSDVMSKSGEGLIWPFSLAFGTLLPSVALERMRIERLTLALVVAAAAVPR